MNKRTTYFGTAAVSLLTVAVAWGITIFLILLPTFLTLRIENWPEILIGVALFCIHIIFIVAGIDALLCKENGRKMMLGLSLAGLGVCFLDLILFLLGIGIRSFVYQITAYVWVGYLFVLWFYTRPYIKELFV